MESLVPGFNEKTHVQLSLPVLQVRDVLVRGFGDSVEEVLSEARQHLKDGTCGLVEVEKAFCLNLNSPMCSSNVRMLELHLMVMLWLSW